MATKLKIRVVGLVEMIDARAAIEDGRFNEGAEHLTRFCDANYTMRAEHGDAWGDVKVAAALLRKLVSGQRDKAQVIIGRLWAKVLPNLTEARATGAR